MHGTEDETADQRLTLHHAFSFSAEAEEEDAVCLYKPSRCVRDAPAADKLHYAPPAFHRGIRA